MHHPSESALLLACARTAVDPDCAGRIRAFAAEALDWNYVLGKAAEHRIVPLVYRNLTTHASALPEQAMDELRQDARDIARANLCLSRELVRIVDMFRRHDIPAIPYKGPALAQALYGDVSMRPFGDLDIIVPVRAVRAARDLLVGAGYAPECDLEARAARHYLREENDLKMLHVERRILVELHWGITNRRFALALRPDDLWRRLDRATLFGSSVPAVTTEDLLFILCVHGSTHHWQRLVWICDINELVRARADLDWDLVEGTAARLGGRRMLLLGLALANRLLDAPLPARMLASIGAEPAVASLVAGVREDLFREPSAPRPAGEWDRFAIEMRERTRDKLRVALHLARHRMTPTRMDDALLPGPAAWRVLRYAVRPFRLARQYGLEPLKRVAAGFR